LGDGCDQQYHVVIEGGGAFCGCLTRWLSELRGA
jgi:hypothetical protein